MLSRSIARSLIAIVPEKVAAVVTLLPDSASPTTINVSNAWLKPLDVKLNQYGGLNLQGDETQINIPQHELNPANQGHEIRSRDTIIVQSATFRILSATLKSNRTRWECVAQREMA